jgi:hypothetical protein
MSEYPANFSLLPVAEQVRLLKQKSWTQDLDFGYISDLTRGPLPSEAEGWAIVPKVVKITWASEKGDISYEVFNLASNFCGALEFLLERVWIPARNYFEDREINDQIVRLEPKTQKAYETLAVQPGDFWVFPIQFGKRWRGVSALDCRKNFSDNEFGLGLIELIWLLSTHPHRLTHEKSKPLSILCTGCNLSREHEFVACPTFEIWDAGVALNWLRQGYGLENFGAATGFLVEP